MEHPFQPFYTSTSKILILGSFPSVRSRAEGFYYGHPQNRFWKVTSAVFHMNEPKTLEEKKVFLAESGIALFDVIHACDIENSADSSIRNAVPNDFEAIIKNSKIQRIYCNGKAAYNLYTKYVGNNAIYLPSTSPANAAWTLPKLIAAWQEIAN